MLKKPDEPIGKNIPGEIPAVLAINYEVSLPSFRDGVSFTVHPLNFGGIKALLKAEKEGPAEMVSAMLLGTLRREFPEVKESEIDKLEQDDFTALLKLVTSANEGLNNMDFTTPTSTKS